ncbi:MAG: hypothetical protein Q4F74_03830 [Synergistaceae bacterium]|nr:hypothetical protein [Synergistaceae bacterium]
MMEKLNAIRDRVNNGKFNDTSEKLWYGADLLVRNQEAARTDKNLQTFVGFYGKTLVVTEHAHELSALLKQISDVSCESLGEGKYWFYTSIGDAANDYIRHSNDKDGLLKTVIDKAITLRQEMRRLE